MLQDVLSKQTLRPALRRELVREMQAIYGSSERRALRVMRWPRSTHRQRSVANPLVALRLRELAQARIAFGYRRLDVLLKLEGWPVNHKRVYCSEGLILRRQLPRRRRCLRPTGDQAGSAHQERVLEYGLRLHWFMSPEDARVKPAVWRREYNIERPHSSLGYRSPIEGEPEPGNDEATAAQKHSNKSP